MKEGPVRINENKNHPYIKNYIRVREDLETLLDGEDVDLVFTVLANSFITKAILGGAEREELLEKTGLVYDHLRAEYEKGYKS